MRVWSESCGSRESAAIYGDCTDVEEAATRYAEHDVDGQANGLYSDDHVICVETEDGAVHRVSVSVDWDPTFFATEIKP